MKIFSALKTAKDIGGKAPDEFMIFQFGEIEIEDRKPVLFDQEAAKAVLEHFNTLNHDMVIDYEHQTLHDVQAPAAGWVTALKIKEDGLYAVSNWTSKAKKYIENKEYRYFSPVFLSNRKTRRIARLYNLALTNQPKMKNVQALAAKFNVLKQEVPQMLKKLQGLFKLKEDAVEEDVLQRCKDMLAEIIKLKEDITGKDAELVKVKEDVTEAKKTDSNVVACKDVLDVLGLKTSADKTEVLKVIAGFKAPATAAKELSQQVAKLMQAAAEQKRDDLVEIALKSGKTSPDEIKTWGKKLAEDSPEQFEKIVLARPEGSVVPLKNLGRQSMVVDDDNSAEIQLNINKALGVDEEEFKKFYPTKKAGGIKNDN